MRRSGIQERYLSPCASIERPAPVSCLSAGLRDCCFQHSASLEKEEEAIQKSRRSVKEGALGQELRGVGSVRGTALAEFGALLPTSQHIYTHSRHAEQTENGRACQRHGWLTCVGGMVGERVAEGTLGGLGQVRGTLTRGKMRASQACIPPSSFQSPWSPLCLLFLPTPPPGQEKEGTS